MARYIDLDEAIRIAIQACVAAVGHGITQIDAVNIATALEDAPAADVAPRAEVDLYKRLNDELEDELAVTYDKLENAKSEIAREIFEEIKKIGVVTQVIRSGKIIYDVTAEYDALKKKYTEAEPEPPKEE